MLVKTLTGHTPPTIARVDDAPPTRVTVEDVGRLTCFDAVDSRAVTPQLPRVRADVRAAGGSWLAVQAQNIAPARDARLARDVHLHAPDAWQQVDEAMANGDAVTLLAAAHAERLTPHHVYLVVACERRSGDSWYGFRDPWVRGAETVWMRRQDIEKECRCAEVTRIPD